MQASDQNRRRIALAGELLFIGAAWGSLAITIAESLTPGYDVSTETISGLGSPFFSGTCDVVPRCLTPMQPASAIFVSALFILGILQLWSGYLLRKSTTHRRFGLAVAVVGVGALFVGVSYLPFYLGVSTVGVVGVMFVIHSVGALVQFILLPIAAISTYRFTAKPMRYLSMVLGVISLAATVLFVPGIYLGLGAGGMERMIVYPLFVWQIGFGADLFRGLD
jgi:hypothetical membrane protein